MPLPVAAASRAGFGKRGYCTLCSFKDELLLNERMAAGWNSRQINDWLQQHYGFTVNRQTVYSHRDHLKSPEDRIVTAVEKTKSRGPVIPRESTNEQFLEAVRDIARQRAIEHPDEVTLDHGLKAAQILASQKKSGGDILIILARVMTGGDAGYVIEGEVKEITEP